MLEIKSGSNKFYIGESENDPIAYISYVHTEKVLLSLIGNCAQEMGARNCKTAIKNSGGLGKERR